MPLHLATAIFALCAATASAMSCQEAAMELGGFETMCPMSCSKEGQGEGGLRQCGPGEMERQPEMCGHASCRALLSGFNDTKIDAMMAGFLTCPEDSGMRIYNSMGKDYIKVFMLKYVAVECGLSDSLAVSMPAPETCYGAIDRTVLGMDRFCPKQCVEEAGDDEQYRQCQPGEQERSRESCGNQACGDIIAALDDDTYERARQGLMACEGDPNFGAYAIYATMHDGQYLKHIIREWGDQCGHEDRISLSEEDWTTCMGAYAVTAKFDQKCPKKCNEDDEGEGGLRVCSGSEEVRDRESCGLPANPECQNLLAKVKAGKDDLVSGLERCQEVPEFAGLATYAPMIEPHVRGLTSSCGFDWDDLEETDERNPSRPAPAPTGDGSCVAIHRRVASEARSKGYVARTCP